MSPRRPNPKIDEELARTLALAVSLYTTISSERKPADYLIGEFFRRHGIRAHGERGAVAELVYSTLRRAIAHEPLLDGVARVPGLVLLAARELGVAPSAALVAAMATATRLAARDLEALVERSERAEHAPVDEGEPLERFAERHAFPAWIAAELEGSMTRPEMGALFDALNEQPPFAVRVNTARASVEQAAEALRREGLSVVAGAVSPHALRLGRERDLFATETFRAGLVEVQDEGSQLVSIVTDPRPGERVLDLCAGSGGKTLHLGALMHGRGEVFAYDTDRRRLANADKRVRRSGLQNVRLLRDDERFAAFGERWRGRIDRVLVDAPCSGLGTLRRAPDIKLRATPDLVAAMVEKQREVLATAASFVRPGGRLVYATCSILPRENEAAVAWLVERDPSFALVPDASSAETLTLAPHRGGTDGFFIAVLERDATRSDAIEDEDLTA